MLVVPSSVLVNKMSRKASWLLSSSSFVNFIFSVVLFIVCKMSSVLSFLTVARTSSTYLFHACFNIVIVSNGSLF